MDLENVKLDLDAAEEGTWFPFGDDGGQVKIARWNNQAHSKFLRDVHTRYGRKMAAKAMTDDQANEILAQQWPHILTGWAGITLGGCPLEWSPQTVTDLAMNPQYEAFFQQVADISKEEANFRVSVVHVAGED